MRLRTATSPDWITLVLREFDAFLLDHAACEDKAAASADKMAAAYPEHPAIVAAMGELSAEEKTHFAQVTALIDARGLGQPPYYRDPYITKLTSLARHEPTRRLLDRLLVAGIIEARACERLGIVAGALPPGDLKDLYLELTRSEARHHGLFVRLAKTYFDAKDVESRLAELLDREATILASLPLRPAIH